MIARFAMRHAMTRHMTVALIALWVIGAAQPAAAQTASAPSHPPSPAAMLLAKQIVDIKGVKNIFQPLVAGVVEKTKDMFMQTNFMWAKDLNEVAAIEQKKYAPRAVELVDATARIYASHFTEQELKDLLTFYKSPVGQKALVEEPQVLDEAMSNAGGWGDSLSQEVMASMREEMKKRGHDM
ncbi:MAG TPA: DUF2059 domain-containing protein [Xanthobacteraceae bacterium]|nr:DUF2059 domain-containing protein [Xanthobacteraceae bacterium]